jgi:hypothetical protein
MEKSYRVVGNTGHWAVAEDGAEPAGDYATREGALEAIYFAASNDIKSGHGDHQDRSAATGCTYYGRATLALRRPCFAKSTERNAANVFKFVSHIGDPFRVIFPITNRRQSQPLP